MSNSSTHASHHHPSAKLYAGILGALLVLTVITVFAASFDFGSVSIVIALAIATVKASLVALFFMHLRYDKPMNALIFCAGLFFLGLFLWFCMMDAGSRPNIYPSNLKVRNPPALTPAPVQPALAPTDPPTSVQPQH